MAPPCVTATGSFPIGFRQTAAPWQRGRHALAAWATANGFAHLDPLGPVSPDDVRNLRDAGLAIGTADLLRWPDLLSPDESKRRDASAANVAHVRSLAAAGVTTFFAVAAPENPALPRAENFGYAAESYRTVCRAARDVGAGIALEGPPGKPPHFATIGCTPADLRDLVAAVDSDALGVNFDPSHPARMGIDPLRMLREFAPRVFHVHAKDTLRLDDALYDHGHLQQATFAKPRKFGAYAWRYTLPGKGNVAWPELLSVLAESGYAGRVSIELEDEDVEGEAAERAALVTSKEFLRTL